MNFDFQYFNFNSTLERNTSFPCLLKTVNNEEASIKFHLKTDCSGHKTIKWKEIDNLNHYQSLENIEFKPAINIMSEK